MATGAELNYDLNATALEMANTIFGPGVVVVGATYTGDDRSSGTYSGGDSIAPGVTPGDTGVILSTGRADRFTNSNGDPNRSGSTSFNTQGVDNDPAMNAAAGANTFDAAFLEVDFIPTGETMTMQFVFSSEEYPEFAGSIYNDVVTVWVNGQPIPLEVSGGSSSVGNVNDTNNQNLYVDNTGDQFNTEMDGFTVTMTLTMPVIPGQVNTIRIGIADVSDSSYDSNLLIAGDSVQTVLVANADTLNVVPGGTKTLDALANDSDSIGGALTITHINGIAVSAGDTVTLTTGQQITLNADGTFSVTADLDVESVSFTYTVENTIGVSDVGFVTINSVPCFVAGTLIATDRGEVPVEELAAGDLVRTLDEGLQPLRWVGRRTVAAKGSMAPVRIARGALGNRSDILLSPLHRVLLTDSRAELLFGAGEVLVAVKELINDSTVRVQEGGQVDYVHILFDRHQIVFADGLEAESFLPGPQTTKSFEREMVAEICAIFPELDPETGAGYSPAARRTLRSYEAQLLLHHGLAA